MQSRFASADRSSLRLGALVVAGSVLMALGAQIAIPVPFTPVPITGQTFALALVVALLGTRAATASVLLYLFEGVVGLPVFAKLGLLGPTAGYLIAFPFAAFVTGWLFDRGLWSTYGGRLLAIFAGTAVVFAGGASGLALATGWPVAIATGVAPFLLGDALKTIVAAAVAPWVRRAGIGGALR